MDEKVVDARGQLCPQPLILTKRALKELATGQRLRVLIDNEISKNNVARFLADNGLASSCSIDGSLFTLLVTKTKEELTHPDAVAYCVVPEAATGRGSHVVAVTSDKMGNGPDELGAILMKAFVNAIKEVAPLPSEIVFYNSGVLLTVDGSSVVDSLKELESLGVKILVCGTCVNYFEKKDLVRVGAVSNMYTILDTLTAARSVVRP